MIKVSPYSVASKETWDDFVSSSKNGLFLFHRDYMEYHSDRFTDHSLLFFENGKLIAILPANIESDCVYSHAGLTFGGIVSCEDMTTPVMIKIFDALLSHLSRNNVKKLVYKAIPHIYHTIPSQEDLYALFHHNANLVRRDVTSTIDLAHVRKFNTNRLRAIERARKNGVSVARSHDFKCFMSIVETVLRERHGVKPVHTFEEVQLLESRFPDNIKLFAGYKGEAMLAGVLVYESKNVAHAQYIANSDEGRKVGALDLVFSNVIGKYQAKKRYFDFGISTEKDGHYLNVGLIDYKEAYGARAVVHDTFGMVI